MSIHFRGFFKKALPIAAAASAFIPGVGPAVSSGLTAVGNALGVNAPESVAPPTYPTSMIPGNQDFIGPDPPPSLPTQTISAPASGTNWGGALGALAPIGTGIANMIGQRQTNVSNASQAQKQMDFQASQTGTSYQRGVADMKAAGLNPMLAYSQGGASSGSGASAQMGTVIGAGSSSAFGAAQSLANLSNIAANTEKTNADTAFVEGNTSMQKLHAAKIIADTGLTNNSAAQAKALTDNAIASLPGVTADSAVRTGTVGSRVSSSLSDAAVRGYEVPHARNQANMENSYYGRNIRPYLPDTGSVLNSAKTALSLFGP